MVVEVEESASDGLSQAIGAHISDRQLRVEFGTLEAIIE